MTGSCKTFTWRSTKRTFWLMLVLDRSIQKCSPRLLQWQNSYKWAGHHNNIHMTICDLQKKLKIYKNIIRIINISKKTKICFFIGVTEKGCWSQRPKATESPKMPEVSKVPSTWPLSATSTEPRVTIHKDECSAFTSADQDVIHNIYIYIYTSSAAQGGGGSFKNRKLIGEIGCCESRMAERNHWWTERWLELCFLEWLQWSPGRSPHLQLLDVVWCSAAVVVDVV